MHKHMYGKRFEQSRYCLFLILSRGILFIIMKLEPTVKTATPHTRTIHLKHIKTINNNRKSHDDINQKEGDNIW